MYEDISGPVVLWQELVANIAGHLNQPFNAKFNHLQLQLPTQRPIAYE
jgi:hypothetical protein